MDLLQLRRSQHVDTLVHIDLVINSLALIEKPYHSLRSGLIQPMKVSYCSSIESTKTVDEDSPVEGNLGFRDLRVSHIDCYFELWNVVRFIHTRRDE